MSGILFPAMPIEKTQAEIPFGVIEYTATFKRPIISAWTVPGVTVDAVLSALEPWGFKIDGVELKTNTEKLNDYAMVFRRTPPGVTFTVGTGKLVINAENLDWTEAERFVEGMTAGVNAVIAASSRMNQFLPNAKAEINWQQIGLGMHIQLKTKPRKEITAHLVNEAAFNILDGEVKFQGIILQRDKTSIIIDASLAYANALFVRMFREHPPEATFQEIAQTLHRDEEQLFEVLGLEGIL
jgi:hypothetical protein